jgi:calcium-translocating P-type ATPase
MKPAPAPTQIWHALQDTEVAQLLAVDPETGLADDDVASRRLRHGPNAIAPRRGRHAIRRFADQLRQPLVLVLVACGFLAAALGERVDAAVILGVVLVNALAGYLQEGKAAAAMAALARIVASEATVLRNGRRQRVDAAALVPGDIVVLAAGDRVPADLRLLQACELCIDESILTGESLPAAKDSALLATDAVLADRRNMAYAGTAVTAGSGSGIVVATGNATETGRIARLVADTAALATPLTRKMGAFAQRMLWAIIALAALTFAIGIVRGAAAIDMFMAAVALAVGAIPEGLPAAMTITLAIGVARMAQRRAIVRRLPAVEALGSTTVICSDKTGTLTENAMTVTAAWAGGRRYAVAGRGYDPAGSFDGDSVALRALLVAGALCNDADLHPTDGGWRIGGDPTEAALLVAARKAGLDETALRRAFPRRDEIPFDAARQTMATCHATPDGNVGYIKGAPEILLPDCCRMQDADGQACAIDAAAIADAAQAMTSAGLRVLALARCFADDATALHSGHRRDLTLLGLVGMQDPPRPQAIAAIRSCRSAGIDVKMVTGDHAYTALAIARDMGIAATGATALTGAEIAGLDDAALRQAVGNTAVFARVVPDQKLRLVRTLQANGAVVAVTGDGVNDAPALKAADIGIAMGRGGTEVARDAAAMVLTDDNFATIAAAVEEGRGIHDNIVKFIAWTLPTNFGEGLVILAAVLAGTTLPITPLQILWINMTTAVLLGLPLAFEPLEGDVMSRSPRPPTRPILDAALTARIALVGALLLSGAFGLFELALAHGLPLAEARTVAANTFVVGEMFYLLNCRSLTRSIFAMPPFSNPWIGWGIAATAAFQLLFTYLPAMNRLFDTRAIGLRSWGEIVVFGVVLLAVMEAGKPLLKRH